jgi:hypothetical protein
MNFSKYLRMLAEGGDSGTCKLLLQHLALQKTISQIEEPIRAYFCSVKLYIFCHTKYKFLEIL